MVVSAMSEGLSLGHGCFGRVWGTVPATELSRKRHGIVTARSAIEKIEIQGSTGPRRPPRCLHKRAAIVCAILAPWLRTAP
jgi:hypothetical protein